MVDFLYLRVCGEDIQNFQGVLHVAFHPQGQGFQPLKKDEGIERTDGSSRVAQQCGADTGDVGSRACRFGETNAVASGWVSCGNFPEAFQSNFPESTMTPPSEVPWPPMNFVAECTTMSAPCSIGRMR